MKWRLALTMILGLLAGMLFVPGLKWWAVMALAVVCGGICFERNEEYLNIRARKSTEGEVSFWEAQGFKVSLALAVALGLVFCLLNHLPWWGTVVVGIMTAVVFFASAILSALAWEEGTGAATGRQTAGR